ncbi:MAG: beta-ketoacyl-[acyl-carrier-protein] synthase family protein [Candidatus Omnitrophota bacterium]
MHKERIVITGIGAIGSNGIGKDAFIEAIFKGVSGIKPITLFDTSSFKVKTAGEIKDFTPQDFLGNKGLRTLDRSTKLIASATKLALDDTALAITEENTQDIGFVAGNTLGSVNSICEFDKDTLIEGPQYVNPALFPNTVINSPASQAAIRFNIKGFNTTISTGFSASLDAVKYAVDFLRLGRAKVVLAAGVEELCVQVFLGFLKTGFLAGLSEGKPEISCPFDKRRNGIILGEGSGVLVLEGLEHALARKAKIYAEITGFGQGFDSYRINKYNPSGYGIKKAIGAALEDANLGENDIDYISSAANSTQAADRIESSAIKDIFGHQVAVSSIKSMIGECFSATGILQLISAIGAIDKQMIHPTINYQEKDFDCDLNYVINKAIKQKIDNVLINAFGPSGCNASLIISRIKV